MNTLNYKDFKIGQGHPCFIIAEAGINHNGDIEIAKRLVKEAKQAGADCVKFQSFLANRIVTLDSPKAAYQMLVTDPKESQFAMLKKVELSPHDTEQLMALCRQEGIAFLSTPYDIEDAYSLRDIGADAFKVASGQLVEHSFLKQLARMGLPIILSTGMATLAEVDEAVSVLQAEGHDNFALLQCTTDYPSQEQDANLRVIQTYQQAFQRVVGYSDHTVGCHCAIAAVALGASIVEKHFTLDKTMEGPDHSSSVNPDELKQLVDAIRNTELALGSSIKAPTEVEINNAKGMRRSIVAALDIPQGTVLERSMLAFKRPTGGIEPKHVDSLLGKTITRSYRCDEPLNCQDLQ